MAGNAFQRVVPGSLNSVTAEAQTTVRNGRTRHLSSMVSSATQCRLVDHCQMTTGGANMLLSNKNTFIRCPWCVRYLYALPQVISLLDSLSSARHCLV